MLEYTFGLMKEADAVNDAIGKVLESGQGHGGPETEGQAGDHRSKSGKAVSEAL